MTYQSNGGSNSTARLIINSEYPFYDQLALVDNVRSRFSTPSEHIAPFHILIQEVQHTRSDPRSEGTLTVSTIPEFGLGRISVVPRSPEHHLTPAISPGFSTVDGTLAATGTTSNSRNGVSESVTNGIASRVTEPQGATNGIASRSRDPQGATNGIASRTREPQGTTNGVTSRTTESPGATNGIDS